MSLEIGYYTGQNAVALWPTVAELVQPALDKSQGELVLADFPAGFLSGQFQLFLGYTDGKITGCMITEFVEYPQVKAVRVVIAAGAGFKNFMKQFMGYLKNWAKQNQASFIEAWTPPAMTRYHRRFGAKKVYDIIRFSLEG